MSYAFLSSLHNYVITIYCWLLGGQLHKLVLVQRYLLDNSSFSHQMPLLVVPAFTHTQRWGGAAEISSYWLQVTLPLCSASRVSHHRSSSVNVSVIWLRHRGSHNTQWHTWEGKYIRQQSKRRNNMYYMKLLTFLPTGISKLTDSA